MNTLPKDSKTSPSELIDVCWLPSCPEACLLLWELQALVFTGLGEGLGLSSKWRRRAADLSGLHSHLPCILYPPSGYPRDINRWSRGCLLLFKEEISEKQKHKAQRSQSVHHQRVYKTKKILLWERHPQSSVCLVLPFFRKVLRPPNISYFLVSRS